MPVTPPTPPSLFAPLTLRGLTLRNRIFVSPMCQYSSVDGLANDWHMVHLGSRAVGGAALVLTEAAGVVPEGRISPDDLGVWSAAHAASLAPIFTFIKSQGAVAGMQLAHAGRKASTPSPWKGRDFLTPEKGGWPVVGPSELRFAANYPEPQPLDDAGLARVRDGYAAAAGHALAAGAQVVEVHAAHGYLLHEFLSPLSNTRTDSYGGSLENRSRLLRETVEAVRKVWPDELPLFVRISAEDYTPGGWTIEDSVALAKMLGPLGVDLMDCSSGGNVPDAKIPLGPGYQVHFSERIRREAGIVTGAVGMITDAAQADTIIRTGQADAVLLARELLRDPYWPHHAAKQLGVEVKAPVQYGRAL